MKLIAAVCNTKEGKLGIGLNNKIPWFIPGDLAWFKEKTIGSVVVMGMNTYRSIGFTPLKDRINIVLTNDISYESDDNVVFANSIKELDEILEGMSSSHDIYIIGGEQIYKHYIDKCDELLITIVEKKYRCDAFLPDLDSLWVINERLFSDIYKNIEYNAFSYVKSYVLSSEHEYINLGPRILRQGSARPDRTNTGTTSIFGHQMRFNITRGVPLLTAKRVPYKTCIEELLWFLRGETDAKILQEKGIKIWDGNTSREFLDNMGFTDVPTGELRKGYGHQIRRYGRNGVDQLKYVENLLKTDPFSRRIMWNLWNASDLDEMVLTPCHNQVQFYVDLDRDSNKMLSSHLYCRSSDYFLGLPFNIFSYVVLTYILAIRCDMIPKELIISLGDAHIYSTHVEQVLEMTNRPLRPQPLLILNDKIKIKDYEDITVDDFKVLGYLPHPSIKADMAV